MSGYQFEANKLKARSDLYQKLAHLETMLWITTPSCYSDNISITIFGKTLELRSVREKHPKLLAIIESEIKQRIEEIKHVLETKDFP